MKVLVLVFLFVGAVFADHEDVEPDTGSACDKNPHQLCSRTDLPPDFYEMETLLPNEDFLKKHCNTIIAEDNCLMDYERQCPGITDFDPYGIETPEKRLNISQGICDEDSAIGKAYRSSVDCVNGAASNVLEAAEETDSNIRGFRRFLRREKPDMGVPHHLVCFGFKLLFATLNPVLTQACGENPGLVLQAVVPQVMSNCPPEEEMEELNLLYARYTVEKFQNIFKRK